MAIINDPNLEFLRIQFNKIESINSAFSRHFVKRGTPTKEISQIRETIIGLNSQVILGLHCYFYEVIRNQGEPVNLGTGDKSYSFTPEQLEKLEKLNEDFSEILKSARITE